MKTENTQLLLEMLHQEWKLLQSAVQTLGQSALKCSGIAAKEEYTFEEQESFDSLTSKFNRTSDLFTQKIIRTSWMLMHEPFVSFIDMMNLAEKIGMIDSADKMIEIRDMRNQIAHEYIPEAIRDLVPEVISLHEELISNINKWYDFVYHRGWLKD
jgi:hypothetical protein